MLSKKEKTDLAKPIDFEMPTKEGLALLRENLGTDEISPFQCPVIGIQGLNNPKVIGDLEEVECIILKVVSDKQYFKKKFSATSSSPPDCSALDSPTGTGDPGGVCKTCSNNQWGSGDGNAKLCSDRMLGICLVSGSSLPARLSIPSTSLKAFRNYGAGLVSRRQHISSVVTKITVNPETNRLCFESLGPHGEEMTEHISSARSMIESMKSTGYAEPAPPEDADWD